MQTYYPHSPWPDPDPPQLLRANQYIETSDGKCRYYPNK